MAAAEDALVVASEAGSVAAETVADRCRACILGGLVADAAAMPLEWIYDEAAFDAAVADRASEPEFRAESANPFYRRPTGCFSAFGDQPWLLLQSLVAAGGWDASKYASAAASFFGRGSEYDAEGRLGRPVEKRDWPIDGPWIHRSLKHFVGQMGAAGEGPRSPTGLEGDQQIDSAVKVPPLVALLAGSPRLEPAVEEAARTMQNDDLTVASALTQARTLEFLVLGRGGDRAPADAIRAALDFATAELENPDRRVRTTADSGLAASLRGVLGGVKDDEGRILSHRDTVRVLGASCHLPEAHLAAVQLLSSLEHLPDDGSPLFIRAVRCAILAHGTNASRSGLVGAVVAAASGSSAIPATWLSRVTHGAEAERLAGALVSLRRAEEGARGR